MFPFKNLFPIAIYALLNFSCSDKNTGSELNKSVDNTFNSNYFSEDKCMGTEYVLDTFIIGTLKWEELPYITGRMAYPRSKKSDDNGVPVFVLENRPNYHPVYIMQHALNTLDVLHTKKDSSVIPRLETMAKKLISTGMRLDSCLMFIYTSDFNLHGYSDQNMEAPWFSAMAQGQGISLFLRLFKLTNDSIYLTNSKLAFNSFKRLKGNSIQPWFSCIDKNGNLWLEEFPRETPNLTLNGMIFAIFGVYEYYILTGDLSAKKILNATLTTIKSNIKKFRVKNELSYYCLKHHVQNEYYHNVHIDQLKILYNITKDEVFLNLNQQFIQDIEQLKKAEKKSK